MFTLFFSISISHLETHFTPDGSKCVRLPFTFHLLARHSIAISIVFVLLTPFLFPSLHFSSRAHTFKRQPKLFKTQPFHWSRPFSPSTLLASYESIKGRFMCTVQMPASLASRRANRDLRMQIRRLYLPVKHVTTQQAGTCHHSVAIQTRPQSYVHLVYLLYSIITLEAPKCMFRLI